MTNHLHSVGVVVSKNSKAGGGSYVVIGHINCPRCETIIEEREQLEPTKEHRKKGKYYEQSLWCYKCGLWEGKNLKIIKQVKTMIKKYNVSIEQPLCKTFEVEAEDIDQALDIAREKYNSGEFVLTNDDIGTDAQIKASAEDESESTDWDDL